MKKIILLSYLLLGLVLISCTENITTVGPNTSENLIHNIVLLSSFEDSDGASYDGWTNPGPPFVKLANDAPQEGGHYSIFLKARSQGAVVYKSTPAIEGTHNYKLTFWSKATEDPGYLELYLVKGTSLVNKKVLRPEGNIWTKYTIEAQYTAAAGDSLEIKMNGSSFRVPQGFTYFDFILLERMD